MREAVMQRILIVIASAIIASSLSSCAFLNVSLTPEVQPLQERVLAGEGRDKIVLMDLTGVITSENGGSSVLGGKEPGMLALVREQLDRARADRNVRAVVIRINSPGGGVTASDTLYHEIKKYRQETGVTVVAHILDTGTSGAYYAAMAADRISAQPTSITGSIGVTMLRIDATGLMQKIGVQALEISSGVEKGMGSPFRRITDEERKIFQGMIDSMYDRFVSVVAEGRKMSPEQVRRLADGRIYTSEEAKQAGLIDSIGYLEDAFTQARTMAHLDKATVVTYQRPGDYRPNIYSMNLVNINFGDLAGPGIRFAYMWMP
jgi:protease-4